MTVEACPPAHHIPTSFASVHGTKKNDLDSMNTNHRNQDATVYVGNLTEECNEALLWELFAQVGRVVRVSMALETAAKSLP